MLRAVVSKSSRLPALLPALSRAHCQVPCGIFDDPVRVTQLKEDAATVRKAMVQINDLSGAGTALALNQATRWIITKEDHAKSIISTVSEYMLCQRVKKVRVPLLARPSSPLGAPLAAHRPRPTVLQEVRSSRLTPCPHDRATRSGALRERDRLPAGARRAPLGAGRRGQDEAGGRPGGVRRARPRHRGRGQDVHQVMSAPDCASRSACFLRRTSCYKGRASACVRANTLWRYSSSLRATFLGVAPPHPEIQGPARISHAR